jgi:4-hydroxy-tetrahydrodipicolinate synthase
MRALRRRQADGIRLAKLLRMRQNRHVSEITSVGKTHRLGGVYAAAVTPFDADFRPAIDELPRLLDFLASRGCHGALLLGTTGEGPSCSPGEREAIMRAAAGWRTARPDFRLLAGTGTPSLEETSQLTRLAFDLGFEGVVVLPPYYFRNASDEGLFGWFNQLMEKAVPRDGYVMGYHFPGTAGIGFSLELIRRLKDAFPQQFAGLKDSSHDQEFSETLGQRFGPSLTILSGTDSHFLHALEHGAAGCITAPANLLSPELRSIYDAYREGLEASEMQARVSRERLALEHHVPFAPTLKAILHRKHGLPLWSVKPPLRKVNEDEVVQAIAELEAAA